MIIVLHYDLTIPMINRKIPQPQRLLRFTIISHPSFFIHGVDLVHLPFSVPSQQRTSWYQRQKENRPRKSVELRHVRTGPFPVNSAWYPFTFLHLCIILFLPSYFFVLILVIPLDGVGYGLACKISTSYSSIRFPKAVILSHFEDLDSLKFSLLLHNQFMIMIYRIFNLISVIVLINVNAFQFRALHGSPLSLSDLLDFLDILVCWSISPILIHT